jgi:hypothetical protein
LNNSIKFYFVIRIFLAICFNFDSIQLSIHVEKLDFNLNQMCNYP